MYNGYTNYQTWAVSLWIDNEECQRDHWLGTASYIYNNEAKEQTHFTKMEDATYILADQLREQHHEVKDSIVDIAKLSSSVWADLLNASLCDVNWHEIAKNLLEDIEVAA